MKLSDIYKANQCTDLSDVETALQMLKIMAVENYTPAMHRRLASLIKRKRKLEQIHKRKSFFNKLEL